MVTYGDYFSRKTLHSCGVSPEEKLFKKDETAYTGTQRMDEIRSDISEIYQTLYRGYTKKNAGVSGENFADFQLQRKIVAAFYDSGLLNNAERDFFQTQALQGVEEREKICVEEASLSMDTAKAQKVDAPMKTLSARDIRQ